MADPRVAVVIPIFKQSSLAIEAIESVLRQQSSEFWLERLGEAGVPCGPVSDIAEAMSSEQVAARRMVIRAGGMPMPGSPMKLSAYPDPEERPAAPGLDQHGDLLRAEFGADGRVAAADGAGYDGAGSDGAGSDGAGSDGGMSNGSASPGSRSGPTTSGAIPSMPASPLVAST